MKSSLLLTMILAFNSLSLLAEIAPIRLLEGSQPPYPKELMMRGDDGEVKIQATVDETGTVSEAEIVSASHPAFGQAALESVRTWRFQPASKDGEPVPQTVVIPVIFKLSFKDRINALAGRQVWVDIDELTNKVHTWKDVKRYFPLHGGKEARVVPYPEALRGSGISEEVTFQVILSPDGLVLNPSIVNLKNEELAVPALEHLVTLRFKRPKSNDKPIYLQQKVKVIISENPEKYL